MLPSTNREDFRVVHLDQIEPAYAQFDGDMFAGTLPSRKGGRLSFWLFAPRHPTYDDALTVWMNGGPGCSSFGGCLFEHCPVTIGLYPSGYFGIPSDTPLSYNNYSWTHATHMLYVEQPQGTGFSSGPMPRDESDVAKDFAGFLEHFYQVFDDWKPKRLFFAGESYAGMYVPSIARYLHRHSDANLHGIALGNGWMDAKVQGPAVIDYAWWHGMIDRPTQQTLHRAWKACQTGEKLPEWLHDFTTPDECGIMSAVLQAAGADVVDWGGPNAYDVTTWDSYYVLDDPKGTMAEFYNNPAVQDALHMPRQYWYECLPGAGRRLEELPGKILLAHDRPISVIPYVAELLDAGVRVLIYNGDRDMTTNGPSTEVLLDEMQWSGAQGWMDEYSRGLWLPKEKQLGGYVRHYRNLDFVVVANSGHLVPFNEPDVALDLITRFVGNKTFADEDLPLFHFPKASSHTASPGLRDVMVLMIGLVLGWYMHRCRKPTGYQTLSG